MMSSSTKLQRPKKNKRRTKMLWGNADFGIHFSEVKTQSSSACNRERYEEGNQKVEQEKNHPAIWWPRSKMFLA